MLHRFAEELRAAKVAPATDNLETAQPVTLAAKTGAESPGVRIEMVDLAGKVLGTEEKPAAASVPFEAPLDSGFLRVRQGETTLLEASVHFADTREADFSGCAAVNTLNTGGTALVERHTEEDHLWRAWFLVLLAALLISWHFTREREARKPQAPAAPPRENPA
jgi:hypothetical protein